MADDKLKTGPKPPGPDRPDDAPAKEAPPIQEPPVQETDTPGKTQEPDAPGTGPALQAEQSVIPGLGEDNPARSALGEVVVDFDKINELMLSNPPFGVEWKKVEKFIKDEAASQGYRGRFGAGLPRISDGSFLFLQHLISKMNPPEKGGSRIGIVFNGSPMFSGDAGSGESEIRRWIIENDLLEAIIGLPDQLFYNTGITTYIWILTNRKENRRKGKVRLINGAGFFEKMRKGLGNKRNIISPENRAELVRLYSTYEPDENYMDLDNEDFGYRKIVIERPLLDEDGTPVIDRKGNRKADASLRDYEMVPLKEDIHEYFRREVLPFVPDAWIDESKTKIGYEIPFTRYFYKFTPLRDSSVIMEDIRALEERIQASLAEVFAE